MTPSSVSTPAQDATALADELKTLRRFTYDGADSNRARHAIDKIETALRAMSQTPDAGDRPHKTMTWDEYTAMPLQGWHQVCRDVDGFGGIGIRYMGVSTSSASTGPQADVVREPGYPYELHPDTANLVHCFAIALAHKLHDAEVKYGRSTGWRDDDWEIECRIDLTRHVAKGDPLDVAAYAAFCWVRGWSTAQPQPQQADGRGAVIDALDNSQSLLAMIHQLNTNGSVSEHDWETEGLSDLITKQIKENRAAFVQGFRAADGRGAVPERETCWLIERDGGLYTTCLISCYPSWSTDPWRAARYSTAREADNARLMIADNRCRNESTAVEHMFINKTPRALQQSPATDNAPAVGAQERNP